MANPYRGELDFELGNGRTVTLRMTWGKAAELAEMLGGDTWDEPLEAAVNGALCGKRADLRTLAKAVSILTGGEVSADEVFDASPGIAVVNAAMSSVSHRFAYGGDIPDPQKEASEGRPLANPADVSGLMSLLRRFTSPSPTASPSPSSGT